MAGKMKPAGILACVILFWGCDQWSKQAAKPTQLLLLTAEGAQEASWEVHSIFTATKGPPFFCLSFGEDGGGWRYDVMRVTDTLRTNGDTVKAPLDWGPSLCGWEFSDVGIQSVSDSLTMPEISINPAQALPGNTSISPLLPDTLTYVCLPGHDSPFRKCEETSGHPALSFHLGEGAPRPVHINIHKQ